MLAYKIQPPGNYPEESIQQSEHGESLESKKYIIIRIFCISGWFTVPVNPDKWSSTLHAKAVQNLKLRKT